MQADSKYNGWTNYETWAVNLWLTNEEGSYNYWQQEARETFDQVDLSEHTYSSRQDAAKYALSERMKDDITENIPDGVNGMYADLLGAAISEVNWSEIAESFLEDIEPDADTFLADAQTHLINATQGSRKLNSEVFSLSFDTLAHCRALVEEA